MLNSINGRIYNEKSGVTFKDIVKLMKDLYDKNLNVQIDSSREELTYVNVNFFLEKNNEYRTLTIIEYHDKEYIEDDLYIYLSLSNLGVAKDIIFNIVKKFGGEIDYHDNGEFVKIEK